MGFTDKNKRKRNKIQGEITSDAAAKDAGRKGGQVRLRMLGHGEPKLRSDREGREQTTGGLAGGCRVFMSYLRQRGSIEGV